MDGDYIKVKKGPGREFNFEGLGNAEGWMCWREGGCLLIQISEFIQE